MKNEIAKVVLESYDVSMIPLDATDTESVQRAVDAGGTGDALFEVIWREASVAETAQEAARMMEQARDDLDAVEDALKSREDGKIVDLHQVLLDSYPEVSTLPFEGKEEAGEAVRNGQAGDALFTCLWRKLSDVDGLQEAIDMVSRAKRDVFAVEVALEGMAETSSFRIK